MKKQDKEASEKYAIVIERKDPKVRWDSYGKEYEDGFEHRPIYRIVVSDEEVIELLRLILAIRDESQNSKKGEGN